MARGKTSSDSLYQLIKSLSRTEKRYFKLYVSRHNPKQKSINEKLFNAIATQTDYNEKELIERFSEEEFSKSFSVAKTRLYNNIIESLQFFHSGKSVDNTLYKYLSEIEILYQKSLYNQCYKILKKAKKLALSNEKLELLQIIVKWETKLAESTKYLTKESSTLVESLGLAIQNSGLVQIEFDLLKKKTLFFNELYAGRVHAKNEEIKDLVDSLGNAKKYSTSKTKVVFNQIKSAWHFALNQLKRSNFYSIKALDFLNENETETEISILGNIVYTAIATDNFEMAEAHLRKLKEIQVNQDSNLSDIQRIRLFENIASLDLYLYLNKGEISKAKSTMEITSIELAKYNGQISALNRASFYFNFAQICLMTADFKSSLNWINQLLNHPGIDKNELIFSHGIMLSLIIHYELNNYGYIQSKLKSVERYLQNRNRLHDFEKSFIVYLKSLARDNAIDRQNIYKIWNQELKKSNAATHSDSLLRSFNLSVWLDSKINESSMVDIMGE